MPVMLMPDLSLLCYAVDTGPGELCVELPGGVRICATSQIETGDLSAITKGFFAQINSALAPLQPMFNVIDAVKAVFDCVQAIPESILTLNPQPLIDCMPGLGQAIDKLLKMLPPLSVPVLVRSILHAMVVTLQGVRAELVAMIRQAARVAAAATKAAETGNIHLQVVADCASGNLAAQFQNLNASLAPLNRLLGVINMLQEMAGLPCIPVLPDLADITDTALIPLDATIQLLQIIEAAIPSAALVLGALPAPGGCP